MADVPAMIADLLTLSESASPLLVAAFTISLGLGIVRYIVRLVSWGWRNR